MDRNENLYNSLKSWLHHKNINEIVLVDWSSKEPIHDYISKNFKTDKIKIFRVENINRWILTWAYNLGFQNCSFDKILKLDSDVSLSTDFLDTYKLDEKSFYRGCWKISRNENENHLNGQFYCHKKNLSKINYYNEKIVSYGWDDDDLYDRLNELKLNQFFIDPKDIFHIEHEDLERVVNQPEFNYVKRSELRGAINYKIWKNKNFTKEYKWSTKDSLKKWSHKKISENYFLSEILK